jgi:hypothetical protein
MKETSAPIYAQDLLPNIDKDIGTCARFCNTGPRAKEGTE